MNTKCLKSKVGKEFTEVRRLEAIVRNACKSGRQPHPDIINALERSQGAFLGVLSEADEAGLPIGEILISMNDVYQE